jgi:hypothetical protein
MHGVDIKKGEAYGYHHFLELVMILEYLVSHGHIYDTDRI